MSSTTCYASADIPRALLALSAPFAWIVAVLLVLRDKGYGPLDYFALLRSGEVAWVPQAVGWVALVIWIARYFPAAWSALVDGPCLVSANDDDVILPGGRRLRREAIRAVHLQRGLLRKVAYLETANGRVTLPLIFVRNSSDAKLRSLAFAGQVLEGTSASHP